MGGGTLYVVATPLGNLGDLSARATELLRSVAVVAAEDTRRTRALLAHLDAHPRLLSYHANSGAGAARALLGLLAEGQDIALVTDAGTPAVSDPGAALVAAVRNAGFQVVPLAGPCAVSTALSAAGLPADRYLFLGFLPRKGRERERLLARLAREEWTSVLFEAPGRIGELLAELSQVCGGERRAVVARELTKLHEEFQAGTLAELSEVFASDGARGECTVVLAGAAPMPERGEPERARAAMVRLLAAGLPARETARLVVEMFGIARNEAYRMVVELGKQ